MNQAHIRSPASHGSGAIATAATERALLELLELTPEDAFAHFKYAQFLAAHNRIDEAITRYRRALELAPDYPEALRGLAALLSSQDEPFHEAIELLRRAIAIRPNDTQCLNDLGNLLVRIKRGPEAIIYLQHALRLNPAEPRLLSNLALAFMDAGQLPEAHASLLESLRLDPMSASGHNNLANYHIMLGHYEQALACCDLAEKIDPASLNAKCNRALAQLSLGDFAAGWRNYQFRWQRPQSPHRPYPQPLWQGQDLQARRLLLYTDEGLGDRIHFIRYASLLQARGAYIICQTPFPLMDVFKRAQGIDQLVQLGEPLPDFDFHAPLTTLPHFFNTTLATIPATVPYIAPDPARVSHWQQHLRHAAPKEFLIGINWQGNPNHQWDRFRSLPLMHFSPLAKIANTRLVSLQRGPGTEQIDAFQRFTHNPMLLPTDGLLSSPADLADTAAIVACVDLVITVDSATAHLAGALARPVWTLLSTVIDWRWMAQRHDSPWYPTMRLFRQKTLGNWEDVITRVRAALP